MNDAITAQLTKSLSNPSTAGHPAKPGLCLAFTRSVVERACYGGRWEFYTKYLIAGTTRRPGNDYERLRAAWEDPWASDIERSVKLLGFAVPALLRKPGDLVFNHRAADGVGHVGILWNRDTIVELINPDYRPRSIHLPNSVSLTRFGDWPVTLVARLKRL